MPSYLNITHAFNVLNSSKMLVISILPVSGKRWHMTLMFKEKVSLSARSSHCETAMKLHAVML